MSDPLVSGLDIPSRVLVVEDDQGVGSGLAGILAADGHEVRWARTAADAHRLIADRVPDLIILDLGLPDADGLELCWAIRENTRRSSWWW